MHDNDSTNMPDATKKNRRWTLFAIVCIHNKSP